MAKPIQYGMRARLNTIVGIIKDFLKLAPGWVRAIKIPVTVVPIFEPRVITYALRRLTIPIPHNGTKVAVIISKL
ncbi:hypothetical protein BpHYR1_003629 [Brachionus plicatilis]|uniref:Uncharacterized protein n=1 Tax=Brachionus plicatilis TaxID=10195 RepID=A0A3M7PDC6_BRAPC|nr:hypothetical protein BpHYR1_003629 [Brachionus plicatilis]